MLLVDAAVILQNGSLPTMRHVDFKQNMADVFERCGQSLLAASHVLRDERMLQVGALLKGFLHNHVSNLGLRNAVCVVCVFGCSGVRARRPCHALLSSWTCVHAMDDSWRFVCPVLTVRRFSSWKNIAAVSSFIDLL